MDKIDYTIGLLKRLSSCSINDKPYVMLDDVEYIIRNGGVLDISENKFMKPIEGTIKDILDRRPAKWPTYYDDIDAPDYHEWFIKGTNVKLGFDYVESNERKYYCVVSESYDDQIEFETEKDMIDHLEWMLMNENLTWRYYE